MLGSIDKIAFAGDYRKASGSFTPGIENMFRRFTPAASSYAPRSFATGD